MMFFRLHFTYICHNFFSVILHNSILFQKIVLQNESETDTNISTIHSGKIKCKKIIIILCLNYVFNLSNALYISNRLKYSKTHIFCQFCM